METTEKRKKVSELGFFNDKDIHAFTALEKAHFISFAPYAFQSAVMLRDYYILDILDAEREGVSLASLKEAVTISDYGIRILLESGIGIGLLYEDDGKYFITKTGTMFNTDPMVIVNTNFMRDICYEGAGKLRESLETGKPEGLTYLGKWNTVYEGLTQLTPQQTKSWFEFDHYYSDYVFPKVLPGIFSTHPKSILDIGANTGKFSIQCLKFDSNVTVTLLDHPKQLALAKRSLDENGFSGRYNLLPHDMLDNSLDIEGTYDIIWMSQFLVCFSTEEIVNILMKCKKALNGNGRIIINETFWDVQSFHASKYSMLMTSLYFTTIANGNSQMYDSRIFMGLIEEAGLKVYSVEHGIGTTHSLLTLG
jgi:precorrin-6B methylase 2